MRHPAPLPAHLLGTSFATRDAGLGDRRLRAPDLAHPFRGVASAGLLDDIRAVSAAYAVRMREGQVLSHVTALRLHDAPVPWRRRDEIHVSVAFPWTPPRAIGVTGHALQRLDPELVDGLVVSSPAAAWCESAALLRVDELIAAGDSLVTGERRGGRRDPSRVGVAELRRALLDRRRVPGADRARRALPWIREGVDSAAETALRLLLVRSGLAEPVTDHPVAGFHADLAYLAARIAIEYEGDVHRVDRIRWMRDVRRRERMEDAGWRVIRVVADDLRAPAALVARLRRLLAARDPG
jgi:very-short-patch-repair endonuclease